MELELSSYHEPGNTPAPLQATSCAEYTVSPASSAGKDSALSFVGQRNSTRSNLYPRTKEASLVNSSRH